MIEMAPKASHSELGGSNSEFKWLCRPGKAKVLAKEPSIIMHDPFAWAREHSTNTQGLVVEDMLWNGLELPNKQKRGESEHVVGESSILHPTA